MTRDSQRSRVYAAENAITDSHGQTIPDDELQSYVDDLLDRRAIRSRWGVVRVTVERGRGGGVAYPDARHITLGVSARNPWLVCHELAHILTPGIHHGPEFAGVYLFLVEVALGRDARRSLLEQMRRARVKRSNAGIPAVRADVPSSREERRRSARRAARAHALSQIEKLLASGTVSKGDLRRLAS